MLIWYIICRAVWFKFFEMRIWIFKFRGISHITVSYYLIRWRKMSVFYWVTAVLDGLVLQSLLRKLVPTWRYQLLRGLIFKHRNQFGKALLILCEGLNIRRILLSQHLRNLGNSIFRATCKLKKIITTIVITCYICDVTSDCNSR